MDLKGAILRNFYDVGTCVGRETPEEYFSLKVPHYQRPYKWDKERVGLLITDWHENRSVSSKENSGYFAGAVVTVTEQGEGAHSLIDGQQRLTTLFLANYINFIFIRNLLLYEITNKRCGKISEYCDALDLAVKHVFRDLEILSAFENTSEKIRELSDDDKMDELHEEKGSAAVDEFYELLWIPEHNAKNYNNDEEYQTALNAVLEHKMQGDPLNLHYDRKSFNINLVNVLSRVYIDCLQDVTQIKFNIYKEEELTDDEKTYSNAVRAIYEGISLEEITPPQKNSYLLMQKLHETLNNFLSQISVCVIQTGKTEDAYTLFEVMNDRALELDDLDLIKNQFFKKFVLSNPSLPDVELDRVIAQLDKQWGESIFHHEKMRQTYKNLVTYFTTVFITGNNEISNKKNVKYRKFLDDYLKEQTSYSDIDVKRDFNIFQVCFDLLVGLELPLQKRDEQSLSAEYESSTSEFKRTMYFLNAQKQDGVMSGLVNSYLHVIGNITPDFNPAIARDFLDQLLKANDSGAKKDLLINKKNVTTYISALEEQAKGLWKVSMLSPKADQPREFSRSIIARKNLKTIEKPFGVEYYRGDLAQLKQIFESWLREWSFRKDSVLEIKTLFARLIQYQHSATGKLERAPIGLRLDLSQIRGLELDHLVAQKVGGESIFSFKHEEREKYVHDLGNMMPLPKSENIKKSNNPLEKSLKFYEESGLGGHFLIQDLNQLIHEVQTKKMDSIHFFSERKEQLINYFKQII